MRYIIASLFQLVIVGFFTVLLYIEQFQEYATWLCFMSICSWIVFTVLLVEVFDRVFNFWYDFKEFRKHKKQKQT